MLRMRRPIFGSGKAVVLDTVFFVAKGITELGAKVVYAAALINTGCYWPNGVPGGLIDTCFEYKEVGDVVMIDSRTEDIKLFKIFCMKKTGYVMKIVSSWTTLYELEIARIERYFIDSSGTKDTNQFTYWHQFGIDFR